MTQKNLGIATAYGYAKSKGYTGTEEEFALLMASYATVAQEAAESATQAAQSASTAVSGSTTARIGATTATNKAKDAEAYAIGKRDGEDVGSTDPAYHNNSKYYAEAAEESATRIQDAIDAATAAAGNANTAADDATEAAEDARAAIEGIPDIATIAETQDMIDDYYGGR